MSWPGLGTVISRGARAVERSPVGARPISTARSTSDRRAVGGPKHRQHRAGHQPRALRCDRAAADPAQGGVLRAVVPELADHGHDHRVGRRAEPSVDGFHRRGRRGRTISWVSPFSSSSSGRGANTPASGSGSGSGSRLRLRLRLRVRLRFRLGLGLGRLGLGSGCEIGERLGWCGSGSGRESPNGSVIISVACPPPSDAARRPLRRAPAARFG